MFPLTIEETKPAWLTEVLRACGALSPDDAVTNYAWQRVGEGQGGMVARLTPTYSGKQGPYSLIAKFSQSNEGSRSLVAALDIYRNEVLFYNVVAATTTARHPVCYFAEASNDGTTSLLLLEDFPRHTSGDQCGKGSVEELRQCLIQLARLHAPFWGKQAPPTGIVPYDVRQGPATATNAAAVWNVMISRFKAQFPDVIVESRSAYFDALPVLLRWSTSEPATVIHGDFRLDNLLFGQFDTPDALILLDWQMVSWGRGVLDVAYLLTQNITYESRGTDEAALIEAYCTELGNQGVSYAFEQCWADYRKAALIMFTYAVCITGGMDIVNERAQRWMGLIVQRMVASFEALDLVSLLHSLPE